SAVAAPPNPVEYVRGLSPDDKQAVFLSLLREAVELNGDRGLIPIDDHGGTPFGYFVPPAAAAQLVAKFVPPLTPEQDAQMTEAMRTPAESAGFDETLAWLKLADTAPVR
ncbi:MAG: hypothetical protein ACRC7O_09675, partial [Fimbriiglobus sp.]